MTEAEPLRLRLDSEAGRELQLALGELPSELPSEAALGALRLALTRELGEPVRLRREDAQRSLVGALSNLPNEAPSSEQLQALRARLPGASRTAVEPRTPVKSRIPRPKRRVVTLLAWLVPAAAAAMSGAYWATREAPPPAPLRDAGLTEPEPSAPQAPRIQATPLPSVSVEPPPLPSSSASASKPAPQLPSVGRADPEAELSLMRDAQAALGASPAQALELSSQHVQRFPHGVLAQEREVVAIDALARLGRTSEAQARAARFRKSHPESAYLPRIERLVGAKVPAAELPKPASSSSQ